MAALKEGTGREHDLHVAVESIALGIRRSGFNSNHTI